MKVTIKDNYEARVRIAIQKELDRIEEGYRIDNRRRIIMKEGP